MEKDQSEVHIIPFREFRNLEYLVAYLEIILGTEGET